MVSDVLHVLNERGFIAQITDEAALSEQLRARSLVIYTGYDPTADSLHVGHLLTLMALKHFERAGHRPLVVLGGGTAMVGDPSGKSEMRQLLDAAQIGANVEALRQQIGQILDVSAGKSQVVNNAAWLNQLNYVEFLRDIGRHFSVNRMLAAEAYKQRLERGLSFLEFNYQLLQAFDFLTLRREYNCRLQLGGDDQWGNILAGVDLCRRVDQELVFGLTYPLLTTATGAKMGKTASGAVWLDPKKLAPYDYFQYWINTHDADVQRLLAIFTFLPMDEIRAVSALQGAELNVAKTILAYEATAVVHGPEVALAMHRSAQGAFGGRTIASHVLPSSDISREAISDDAVMPTTEITADEVVDGIPLVDLMVRLGFGVSKKECRRLIAQGAVQLNNSRIDDGNFSITMTLLAGAPLVLRAGKKRIHRVILKG